MDLNNKTAVVTGGTDGIGLELARRLKAMGTHVIVVGRRADKLAQAQAEGLEPLQGDLSNIRGCDAVLASLHESQIDILVNNAGTDPVYTVGHAIAARTIDDAIFLNLNAPIHLIIGLLPILMSRPAANIVNVTSGVAIAPSSDTPIYCATKAGLRSFTMALRAQLKATCVTVTEVLPPMVDTEMTREIAAKGKMTRVQCVTEIVAAIVADKPEVNIGQVKILRIVESLSPALARRLMLRG